jgi:gas vesicle protein
MSDRDEFGAFLVGFIVGGLTGAVVALLFAPQSGEETRALIKDKSIELRDRAQHTAEEALARAEATAAEARARADELARQLRDRGQAVYDDVRERGKAAVESLRKTKKSEGEEATPA